MVKILLIIPVTFVINSIILFSQGWINPENRINSNFYKVQESFDKFWSGKEIERGNGWKQYKRWEYFWEPRVYPDGNFPNANEILKSYNLFLNNTKDDNDLQSSEFKWKEAGPVSIPVNRLVYQSSGLGRLNVVRIHPNDDNIIWVGSAGGGAWYSTNKGQNWNVANFTDILSLGVSDIAFSPSSPNIMYIATGDKNGSFMTNEYSIGILKSTDNGLTWKITGQKYNPYDYFLASKILIHPDQPNVVFVATSRAILKTTDGGESWKIILESNSFVRDIEFMPGNPEVIFASNSGRVFKSSDGGATWTQVHLMSGASRIELAVTTNDPNYLYAVSSQGSSGAFGALARSTDGGTTFTTMSTKPNILSIEVNGTGSTGQGNYDLALICSPVNKDLIFVGGIHTWMSTNGGVNWKILNHWTGSYNLPYVHADQHYFTINPKTLDLYTANDGGLYKSTDNGSSWIDISDGLAISQFYRINVSPANNDMIIGGTQDNGTFLYKNKTWSNVNGGDGMDCAIDANDDNYAYSTTQYGNLFRSTNGGFAYNRIAGPDLFQNESSSWIAPFQLNPLNQSSIIIGYRNLYKTTNRGASWTKLTNFTNTSPIRDIEISESDTNIIYISVNASLYKSVDGGRNFSTLKSFTNFITDIESDPSNPNRVFVTCSGYTASERVFEINGTQIKNITYNLPNVPANTIVFQKNTAGTLFIGTDIGVMKKLDDFSDKWISFSENLPPAVVSDLKINYSAGKLYAGTYGRGAWEVQLYSCDIPKPEIKVLGTPEFCTGDSVILEVSTPFKQFIWSNGERNSRITVRKSGSYFVNVKDDNGCTNKSDAINIVELFVPSFSIKSNKEMVICGNDTISLSVPIGFTEYRWSTGDTNNRIWIYEPGYYKITAKSSKGCDVKDSVYIYKRLVPPKPNIYEKDGVVSTDSASSYKWFVDDVEILNSNKREILAPKTGNYYVITYNEYGCGNSSDKIDVISSVKNSEIFSKLFTINPNPFTDYLRLIPNVDIDNAELSIIDILGNKIINDNIHNLSKGSEYILNLSNFNSGSYQLIININDKFYSSKIIKLK